MKRFVPVLLLAALLSSCLDTQSHYTPEVSLSAFITSSNDTLLYYFDDMSQLFYVDSLIVGDTVTFAVGYASLGNNLVSTHLSWDTAYVKLWSTFTSEMLGILLNTSDTAALNLYLPTGYNYVGLPIWLVPKKAGETKLTFTATSDSKYSPGEETIILRILNP